MAGQEEVTGLWKWLQELVMKPLPKFRGKRSWYPSALGCPTQWVTFKIKFESEICFNSWFTWHSGPSLRLEPDHETLQLARRVVSVVQGNKGMNNNNHIHNNQSNRVSAQGKSSGMSTVSNARPVRNAPPRPSNPAPNIPTGQLRPVTPSSGLNRNPSMRSTRAPPPPSGNSPSWSVFFNRIDNIYLLFFFSSGPPPPNQPVLRPPVNQPALRPTLQANNPTGGFRLPNPGAFRLPSPAAGREHVH